MAKTTLLRSEPRPDGIELHDEQGLYALSRVQRTAQSIANRVRIAITPPGAEFQLKRVLVVDDQPDAADAMATVLELLGFPVRACYSGLAALAIADTFDPQVCLLDLMMPGMDGLELADRLKTRLGGRPLLLVATSGQDDFECKARTALAGFHEHITKPVDVRSLMYALVRLGQIFVVPNTRSTVTIDQPLLSVE